MRSHANQIYWDLVAALMHREGLTQRQAQHEVIVRTILKHHEAGMTVHAICRKLEQRWGLHFTSLYKHLARARRTICIP